MASMQMAGAVAPPKPVLLYNISYPYIKTWDIPGNYVEFELHDIDVSLVNALRRCIMGSVPSIGFRGEPNDRQYEPSSIEIIINDSPLHNQFLIHRLSMLPLHISNVDTFNANDYEFTLDAVNRTNFHQDITTEHFKIRKISTNAVLSDEETRAIFPPHPITKNFILITRLKPKYYMYGKVANPDILEEYKKVIGETEEAEEEVRLTVRAKACVGTGIENGHFNPTSCAAHSYKVDPERAKIAERAYIQQEQEAATRKSLTPYTEEALIRRFNTTYLERHYYQNAAGCPTQFNFKIESIGVIPPLVIFRRAIDILKERVNAFNSALIRNDSENIKIEPSKEMLNGYRILVSAEDDTLGNILQAYMTSMYADITLPAEKRLINYVGYVLIHPLERRIAITIQAVDTEVMWSELLEKIISPVCAHIISILDKLAKELDATTAYNNELKKLKSVL